MTLSEVFAEAVRRTHGLPGEIYAHAHEARGLDAEPFDESYIQFLETQIEIGARGPEWTAILRARRHALQPYCDVPLISGNVPVGGRHFHMYAHPEKKVIVHWEERCFPYPETA